MRRRLGGWLIFTAAPKLAPCCLAVWRRLPAGAQRKAKVWASNIIVAYLLGPAVRAATR